MARSKHPKKEVEDALQHAEDNGWTVDVGGSHAWGKIYCPYNDEECRCGEFDGVGVDGGVRVGVEVGRGAAVVIVGLQCEEPVSPGWATRPSYPIDTSASRHGHPRVPVVSLRRRFAATGRTRKRR